MSIGIVGILHRARGPRATGLHRSLHHLELFFKHPTQEFYRFNFSELRIIVINPLNKLFDVLAALAVTAVPFGFA